MLRYYSQFAFSAANQRNLDRGVVDRSHRHRTSLIRHRLLPCCIRLLRSLPSSTRPVSKYEGHAVYHRRSHGCSQVGFGGGCAWDCTQARERKSRVRCLFRQAADGPYGLVHEADASWLPGMAAGALDPALFDGVSCEKARLRAWRSVLSSLSAVRISQGWSGISCVFAVLASQS